MLALVPKSSVRLVLPGGVKCLSLFVLLSSTIMRHTEVTTANDTVEFEVVAEGECDTDAVRIARDYLPDIMLLAVKTFPTSSFETRLKALLRG